jgi:hypothetical protein
VLWLRLDGLLSWARSGATRELGHIRSYEDLVAALRGRCDELDISFRTLDEVAGLADGYSAKLRSTLRESACRPPTMGEGNAQAADYGDG